jgi:hypothetical protein
VTPTPASVGDTAFTYTGQWTAASGPSRHYTSDTTATATINFFVATAGATVSLRAGRNSKNGTNGISLDDRPPVYAVLNSATAEQNVTVWTSPGLARGDHTLTVTVPQAAGSVFGADLTDGTFGGPGYTPAPPVPAGRWIVHSAPTPYAYSETVTPEGVITRRFEIHAGDQWQGDVNRGLGVERCEVVNPDYLAQWDVDQWMAFDFKWEGAVPTGSGQHEIFLQFQQTPEVGDTYGHPPTLSLDYKAGKFNITTRALEDQNTVANPIGVVRYSAPWFPVDTWQRLVMRVRFDPFGDGLIQLWINGAMVYDSGPIPIGFATDPAATNPKVPHIAHGIYRASAVEPTVFTFANLQLGTEDLSPRIVRQPLLAD